MRSASRARAAALLRTVPPADGGAGAAAWLVRPLRGARHPHRL